MDIYDELDASLAKINAVRSPLEYKLRHRDQYGEEEIVEARKLRNKYARLSCNLRKQMMLADPERYESAKRRHRRNKGVNGIRTQVFDDGLVAKNTLPVYRDRELESVIEDSEESENAESIVRYETMKADLQEFFKYLSPKAKAIYAAVVNQGINPRIVAEQLCLTRSPVQICVYRINAEMKAWLAEKQLLRECASLEVFDWERYFTESYCYTDRQKQIGIALCTKQFNTRQELLRAVNATSNCVIISLRRRLKIIGASPYVKDTCKNWTLNYQIWGDWDTPVQAELDERGIKQMLGLMLNYRNRLAVAGLNKRPPRGAKNADT